MVGPPLFARGIGVTLCDNAALGHSPDWSGGGSPPQALHDPRGFARDLAPSPPKETSVEAAGLPAEPTGAGTTGGGTTTCMNEVALIRESRRSSCAVNAAHERTSVVLPAFTS
jgi:hypothetical protein